MCSKEKLGCCAIVLNTIYSFMLLISIVLAAVALGTYQWIETDFEQLSTFADLTDVPGLSRVSCGMMSYCIDSSSNIGECSFPWPTYEDSLTKQPDPMWSGVAACIALGIVLMGIAWLYTLMACFGCYHKKWYAKTAMFVRIAAFLQLVGLIIFGASFEAFKVDNCTTTAADGSCTQYRPQYPNLNLQPDGDIGCKICGPNMAAFSLSSTCTFGWGGGIVIGSMIFGLIASFIADRVEPKKSSYQG